MDKLINAQLDKKVIIKCMSCYQFLINLIEPTRIKNKYIIMTHECYGYKNNKIYYENSDNQIDISKINIPKPKIM